MTCPKCQQPVKPGALFCISCGGSMRETTDSRAPARSGTVVLDPAAAAPPQAEPPQSGWIPPGAPPPAGPPPLAGQYPYPPPVRREGPAQSRSKELLYTLLGFAFLAMVLAFGANKLWIWSKTKPAPVVKTEVRKETIYQEVPVKGNSAGTYIVGESPEQKEKREQELKELKAAKDRSDRLQRDAEQRERDTQEQIDKIARDNEQLRQAKEAADRAAQLQAQQQAVDATRREQEKTRLEQQALSQQRAAADATNRLAEADKKARELKAENDAIARRTVPPYNGPKFGQLIWRGTARKGDEIHIDGTTCTNGELVSGGLPGVQVQMDVPTELRKKIQIVNTPSALNDFRKVSFRVLNGEGPLTVTLIWNTL
jgi:hypothetical protein